MSLAEVLVKKYAKLKGISEEDARKFLAPILEDEDKVKEYLELLSYLDAVETSPGSPAHEVKELLKVQALASMARAHEEKMSKDPVERVLEQALKAQQAIQILNRFLPQTEDPRNKYIEERISRLEGAIEKLIQTLQESRERETSQQFLQALDKIVSKINDQIKILAQRIEKIEKERFSIQEMKRALEQLGFKVLTPAEVPMVDIEKAKEILRKLGYKVEPGFISADQLQKILAEEREKVRQEVKKEIEKEVERDRIEATKEAVITGFKIFGDAIKEILKPLGRKIASELREGLEEMSDEELEEALKDIDEFLSGEETSAPKRTVSPRGKSRRRTMKEEDEEFVKVW